MAVVRPSCLHLAGVLCAWHEKLELLPVGEAAWGKVVQGGANYGMLHRGPLVCLRGRSTVQALMTFSPWPLLPPVAGYLTLSEVFSYGGLMGVVNLLLWAVVGGVWWKFLGLI